MSKRAAGGAIGHRLRGTAFALICRRHTPGLRWTGRLSTNQPSDIPARTSGSRLARVVAVPAAVHVDPLIDVLQRQSGVLARWQARELGISRHVVASRVRAGKWQRWGDRVVLTHNGPASADQCRWAALLHCGPEAVLGGLSAAAVDGLRGYASYRVEVIVPRGIRVPPLDSVRVRYSDLLTSTDVHPVRSPPRTRLARSLVDAASWADDDDRACAILAAGVQQHLVRVGELRAVLALRPRLRRYRLLELTVDDISGGSQSLAEVDLVRLCRSAGLPVPERQAVRTDAAGRRRYLDAVWPQWSLVVEVDGAAHREVRRWADHMWRQNEVGILSGNRVLRFPAMGVRRRSEAVAAQIRRGLELGGWPG